MDPGEEIRLSARGLQLAGLRWHQGAACRVIATHGWLDNAATFGLLAPGLPGCDFVAIDLPGHGRSQHRGTGTMQYFVEYVADIVAAMDALGWEDAVLLGHSLGAGVMSCVAGAFATRVRALVLIEGLAPQSVPAAAIGESLREAYQATQRARNEPVGYADSSAAIAARRKGYWPLSDDASWRLLARALSRGEDGRLHWHTDPRLRQPSAVRLTEDQVMALLEGVRAPALLVVGSGGLFADPAPHQKRLAAVPGLHRVMLAGGHHLHLEAESAPAVVATLANFFAGL